MKLDLALAWFFLYLFQEAQGKIFSQGDISLLDFWGDGHRFFFLLPPGVIYHKEDEDVQGISKLMLQKLLFPFLCPVKTMLLVLLALL